VVKLYTTLGLTDIAQAAQSLAEPFVFYVVRLMPSLVIVTALTQAACCYGIARIILVRRHGPTSAPGVPLALWHAPDVWVWGLIAALGLMAVPAAALKISGWNLTVVYATVYTIQGLAILEYGLKKLAIPAVARGFLIAFILAMPLFVFVTALGVVDVWADFRKVRAGVKPAAPGT
jgi:uncharacterized protein YybS (DUF2232 family)